MIFQNWLKNPSKSAKQIKYMCSLPFWGVVGVKKWSPFFRSASFSTWKGAKDNFFMPTTPQTVGLHVCFIRLALLVGFIFIVWGHSSMSPSDHIYHIWSSYLKAGIEIVSAHALLKQLRLWIYRRYIGACCTRSALARQLIWKGILIYRRYIGAGCTRSALARQLIF